MFQNLTLDTFLQRQWKGAVLRLLQHFLDDVIAIAVFGHDVEVIDDVLVILSFDYQIPCIYTLGCRLLRWLLLMSWESRNIQYFDYLLYNYNSLLIIAQHHKLSFFLCQNGNEFLQHINRLLLQFSALSEIYGVN